MIQLAKDLFIANNNLTKTPKEAKSRDSHDSGKGFADILKMEDGRAEAKSKLKQNLSENIHNEEAVPSAENLFEKEKEAVNKNDDFLNILQLLPEVEFDEIMTSVSEEEDEKFEPEKVDLYTLNFSLENVNLKDNLIISDADFHGAVEDFLPEGGKLDIHAPGLNSGQISYPEDNSGVSSLSSDNESNDFITNMDDADFASKMAEATVNQKMASKSEIKEQKKFDADAANKLDSADDIPEERDSAPPADKATKPEMKEAPVDPKASGAEKSNPLLVKSTREDNASKHDDGKADNKRHDLQLHDLKESDISADKDLDKNITGNRVEFQDFMHKISEQRSAPNDAPKPQQMDLINRGPLAFSEGVGNVVRFINIGGLTKATLIIDPPALGRVNIEVVSTDNGIETILKVSNEQVRMLVQDQMFQLKQNLAQIGVNLAEFTVDIQQDDDRPREQFNNKPKKARLGIMEEEESEAEKIESFRVDLRKGLLHWIA